MTVASGTILGIYGAGGFAREVMPLARSWLSSSTSSVSDAAERRVYFVEVRPDKSEVNGVPLISEDEFFQIDCSKRYFNIAIADSRLRQLIAEECTSRGAAPVSIISPDALIYDNNDLGDGAIICANSMVTSNVKIGKYFHSNIYSYVAHDCVIGDYVTFAPRVSCNGNVHIHDHAYVGTSAVIRPGSREKPLIIGEGAVVGMGAVVIKDVAPHTTVVGNPARPIQKAPT